MDSYLNWDATKASVTNFGTTSQKGRTIIKIELAVTDPWELGDILRRLMELKNTADAAPKKASK